MFLQRFINKQNKVIFTPFEFPRTKILLISDLHSGGGYHQINKAFYRKADVCIAMGDIEYSELMDIQANCNVLNLPLYAIPGNHEPKSLIDELNINNLHGKSIVLPNGLSIAGMGGCCRYKDNEDLCLMTNEESVRLAESIPKADIFITHSNILRDDKNESHSGLRGINEYLKKNETPIHFYGHLHERNDETLPSGTRSICVYRIAIATIADSLSLEYIL